ncbi:hypothetical protein [Microbulbifer aggregans]|uniref:hypothetical protein n=1 Tax=Microbulbifer aggregans TaxID=1769779 RepID=UPI001CFD723F|nr:hypothetical protein [Microbulbifer aggregans]
MQLPKQFLLAKTPRAELPGWRKMEYLDWWLSLAPEVPLIRVRNSSGCDIGLLLGWVLWRGRLLADGDTVESSAQKQGLPEEYDEYGGRFIFLFPHNGDLAAVTDPGGLMSLVYSAERGIAASTPAAMQLLGELQWDEKIRQAFSGGKREQWYSFGATPYAGVQRLMPNHRLTLSDFRSTRFFPLPEGDGLRGNPEIDTQSVAKSIAQCLRTNVKALVDAGHNVAHLTGGFDSRMVLAASRDFRTKMRFQTVAVDDPRTRLDCHIAAQIAREFSLEYRKLPFVPPAEGEIEQWLARTGGCIEDTVASFCTTARVYNSYCHEITGTCGESMRTAYWYSGDEQKETLSARELMRRCEFVENEVTENLAKQWLASLPSGISVGNALDIAYVELRLGCWAGPSMYGHDIALPSISPFNCGRYYKALLSLPEPLRAQNRLCHLLIQYLWPELLRFPINRARGLAKLLFLQQEIRLMLPAELRDHIKRLLHGLRGRDREVLEK